MESACINCVKVYAYEVKEMKKKPVEIVRTSISMTVKLWNAAMTAMERGGHATFSEYVTGLIRQDTKLDDHSKKTGAV